MGCKYDAVPMLLCVGHRLTYHRKKEGGGEGLRVGREETTTTTQSMHMHVYQKKKRLHCTAMKAVNEWEVCRVKALITFMAYR